MSLSPPTSDNTIVNAYCALSAAFFAACAVAQLNDPDPLLWVAGYVTGGCALNVLCVLYHSVGRYFDDVRGNASDARARNGKQRIANSRKDDQRSMRGVSQRIMTVFATGTALIIARMTMVGLLPKLDLHQPPRELAWSILEFEEGREIAGLVILFLHVWKLRGYLLPPAASGGGAENQKVGGSGTVGYTVVPTVLMVGIIAGAVYLWVYYQPMMNTRYSTEHCDGAFGKDRGESSSSSSSSEL
mmetsp:Transcript_15992/g.45896  ORF Transcript_15992/g.45896 Transcript_15992/m.45896 type:complete len:244 (+) Transcript_15992:1863-2594(+)|eukprot:CAMPEP_0181025726 /NCGR_PEP_ID=MMETSP1070-20121207/3254_1 /TAXON_ID=265543 /ORGANISM="Minutocellus polymorphus, Strain NH13" /LENGTH=243 /DNA_ID=CAMNT_0023102859 /DNA_START=1799 /DNA_END=2530 /DNA_ORIENTATION=+